MIGVGRGVRGVKLTGGEDAFDKPALDLCSNLFGVSTFETVWGFRLEEGFGLIAVT